MTNYYWFLRTYIERLEREEEQEKELLLGKYLLPKTMRPRRKEFENLGFEFFDIHEDRIETKLPKGWSIQRDESFCWTYLIDDKKRKRVESFYKKAIFGYKAESYMSLLPKFTISFDLVAPEEPFGDSRIGVKDSNNEIIFDAGVCKGWSFEDKLMLIEKCQRYLNSQYPGWDDPTKYWD